MPPASSAAPDSRHAAAIRVGRQRSRRDSKRVTVPSSPLAMSFCAVSSFSVPATVVIRGQRHLAAAGFADELARLGRGRSHRLVHHRRDTCSNSGARQRHVRAIRRGDNDQVVTIRVGPHPVRRLGNVRAGKRSRSLRTPFRIRRDDGDQPQPRRRSDERRMERTPAEPETR